MLLSCHPEDSIAVRSMALRMPDGHELEPHAHPWGQIVFATDGVMTVSSPRGRWVVPAHRAVWMPARQAHGIRTTGQVRMRTVYLRPDLTPGLADCFVLAVTPLLRELVLEVLRRRMLRDDVESELRLARVLVDQILATPEAPLDLRWPRDPRARRVAERVHAEPSQGGTIRDLADGSGASARTLERLFTQETGMTFGRWRTQARLLHALRLLAAGESVSNTAFETGFGSASAFVAMFRRTLGQTPGRYFSSPE